MSVISSPLSQHVPQRKGSVCRELPLLVCNADTCSSQIHTLIRIPSVQSHVSIPTLKPQRPQVLYHSLSFPPPHSTIRPFASVTSSQLSSNYESDNTNMIHAPQPRRQFNLDETLHWEEQKWSDLSNDEIRSIRSSFASLTPMVRPQSFRSQLPVPAHESCNRLTERIELRLEDDDDADSNDDTLVALTDDTASQSIKSLLCFDSSDQCDEEEDEDEEEEFGPLSEQELYHKRDLDAVKHLSRSRTTLNKYDQDAVVVHTTIPTTATKETNEEIPISTITPDVPPSETLLAASTSFRLRSDTNSIRRRLRRLLDTRTRSQVLSYTTGTGMGTGPLTKAEGYHKRSKSGEGGGGRELIHAAYEVNIPRVIGPPMELMHGERSYESRDLWS